MQAYKRLKLESGGSVPMTSDPFDAEDDWDDDDEILRLVESEVPSYSQMSQAIRAPPINKPVGNYRLTNSQSLDSETAPSKRGFVFKKPSAVTSRPASYTTTDSCKPLTDLENEISRPLSQWTNNTQTVNGERNATVECNDVKSLNKQVSDLIRKQHAHEGEIKWLRTTLKDKDNQITSMRTHMNAESAKQKLQNSEKERGFVRDIESLRSELQFKESELLNVTQALDKLKRVQAAPKPAMPVGDDGFPSDTDVFGASPKQSRMVMKTQSQKVSPKGVRMDIGECNEIHATCDLKPLAEHRLKPRTMSTSKFKNRLVLSNTLRSELQSVQDFISGDINVAEKDQYLQILTDSLTCAKEMCYM